MTRGDIPKVINISTFGKEGQSDYVTYQWELPISKEEKAKAKREKNRDYIKKALFRKVYTTDVDGNRIPLLQNSTYNGVDYVNFVYKHINAWGDSFRANEFYDYERPSKLDNGFEKLYKVTENRKAISAEVDDKVIADILNQVKETPEFDSLPGRSTTPTMTYAGIGSRETPKEVLDQMTEVAKELGSKGFTLNTGISFAGKQEGADRAFASGATSKNLFSPENQGSRETEQTIAKEIHPNAFALNPSDSSTTVSKTSNSYEEKCVAIVTPVFYTPDNKQHTGFAFEYDPTSMLQETISIHDAELGVYRIGFIFDFGASYCGVNSLQTSLHVLTHTNMTVLPEIDQNTTCQFEPNCTVEWTNEFVF
jgi:hypothetical protein